MKKNAEHEEAAAAGPEATGKEADAAKTTGADANAAESATAETGADKAAEDKSAGPKVPDLADRVAELEKINAELQDQYLRKAADFDNYRKRMIKEKQDAIDFANSSLLVDLVEILDNFDRAIASISSADAGSSAASFKEGVSMIRNQMGSMLETKYGLTYYPAKGTSFDPNLHEAIGTAASPDVKEPTVAEEFVKGYKLKDRIIRHAKVMVHTPA
jgi:molecular chaperone GrpE